MKHGHPVRPGRRRQGLESDILAVRPGWRDSRLSAQLTQDAVLALGSLRQRHAVYLLLVPLHPALSLELLAAHVAAPDAEHLADSGGAVAAAAASPAALLWRQHHLDLVHRLHVALQRLAAGKLFVALRTRPLVVAVAVPGVVADHLDQARHRLLET